LRVREPRSKTSAFSFCSFYLVLELKGRASTRGSLSPADGGRSLGVKTPTPWKNSPPLLGADRVLSSSLPPSRTSEGWLWGATLVFRPGGQRCSSFRAGSEVRLPRRKRGDAESVSRETEGEAGRPGAELGETKVRDWVALREWGRGFGRGGAYCGPGWGLARGAGVTCLKSQPNSRVLPPPQSFPL
jgi:hypothetical protein